MTGPQTLPKQQDFCAYTIEMYGRQSFVVLFYHMGNEHETYQYLEQTIVPMICNTVRGRVICTWAVSNGFGNMYEAVRELDHAAEWNLILKKGTLICKEKIQKNHSDKYKPQQIRHDKVLDERDLLIDPRMDHIIILRHLTLQIQKPRYI